MRALPHRHALIAYLLAAVLGAVALVRFSRMSGNRRRVAGLGLAAALVVLSCGYNVRGLFELQVTKRDLRAFEREILISGDPVVTDQWWMAAALAPIFVRTGMYTLNPGTDMPLWLDRVGLRIPSFLYVSYRGPPHAVGNARGSTATLRQQRVIQEMTFSRLALPEKR